MSRFLSFFLPATLGVTGILLGVAHAVNTRNNSNEEVRAAHLRAQTTEKRAAAALNETADLRAQVATILDEAKATSAVGSLTEGAPRTDGRYQVGRKALAEEISAWNLDVLPDGRGLPEGRGDALTGEEIFADTCASCHGDFAEGVDNWPVLAGGFDTLADKDPVKTVGSYWPHLSTVWDYVHRSMPFGAAQTLSDDDVYSIVAYILYSNDLVEEDFELSHENFSSFVMHNQDGFIIDDRSQSEYPLWRKEPCMENCKDKVEITMRASVLNVTPDEDQSALENGSMEATHSQADEPVESAANQVMFDAELAIKGEKVFKKCKACHKVGEGAKNGSGPKLNGVFGSIAGVVDGFKYSNAMKAAGENGLVWTETELSEFLTKPKNFIKKTKMSFSGLKREADRVAIIEYLKSVSQ